MTVYEATRLAEETYLTNSALGCGLREAQPAARAPPAPYSYSYRSSSRAGLQGNDSTIPIIIAVAFVLSSHL